MTKKESAEYLVLDNAIIPVANISHILWPGDDTTHIFLKNGVSIKVKVALGVIAAALKGVAQSKP